MSSDVVLAPGLWMPGAAMVLLAARLARAGRIVAAFKEAEARGEAAVQVDGQMVDYPVVFRARALIAMLKKAK